MGFFLVAIGGRDWGGGQVKIGEAQGQGSRFDLTATGERRPRFERPLRSGINSCGSVVCLCPVTPSLLSLLNQQPWWDSLAAWFVG